jgi:hypothetical protein
MLPKVILHNAVSLDGIVDVFPIDPHDKRALLAIPDSIGRLRAWHYLRYLPHWRHFVALCSKSIPPEYLRYLQRAHRLYHPPAKITGISGAALVELNFRYQIT